MARQVKKVLQEAMKRPETVKSIGSGSSQLNAIRIKWSKKMEVNTDSSDYGI
jgi:hypothetical protein